MEEEKNFAKETTNSAVREETRGGGVTVVCAHTQNTVACVREKERESESSQFSATLAHPNCADSSPSFCCLYAVLAGGFAGIREAHTRRSVLCSCTAENRASVRLRHSVLVRSKSRRRGIFSSLFSSLSSLLLVALPLSL